MESKSQWDGSSVQRSVDDHYLASSRPVADAWISDWINVPSLPSDVAEGEVAGLFSSLAVESVLAQEGGASASFADAHSLASGCCQVEERGRTDNCTDVSCEVDIVVRGELGEVCDPAVRQETGITSPGGNSGGGRQSTGWGTPDLNGSRSPFSSSRIVGCCGSYSGTEQWAAVRSAVINYWPVDYDHESTVGVSSPVGWNADITFSSESSQPALTDGGGAVVTRLRRRSSRTRSLKTPIEFWRAALKDNHNEHCQACYERQSELQTIDSDIKRTSPSKLSRFSCESRVRWFS